MRVLGYTRVSTDEQAINGYGLDDQRIRILEACQRREWQLDCIHADEGLSGKSLQRPQLQAALEQIRDKHADGLIVAKLDRLSRSVMDTVALFDWFDRVNAELVILDLDLDTTTAGGKLMAHVFAAMAQWERETISERVSAALRAARSQGKRINQGSVVDDPVTAERIRRRRSEGWTYRQICEELNGLEIPTLRGGVKWYPSTLQSLLGSSQRRSRSRRTVVLPDV